MINNTFLKYGIVGVLNTVVGYLIIFFLFSIDVFPEMSNFIGYSIGILISYFLNKKYTFKSKNWHKEELPKFVLSMGIAYVLNLFVFVFCYRVLDINMYLSQIFAGITYTLIGYLLSKIWVFKENKNTCIYSD